jgi:exodeoxyribonuclease V beta subunit
MHRTVRDGWGIASYSSLCVLQADSPSRAPETAVEARFLAAPLATASEEAGLVGLLTPARNPAEYLHTFPAGTTAGTFIHELLNWAATQGFSVIASQRDWVHAAVARRCHASGWSAWTDTLTDWLQHFVTQAIMVPDTAGGLAWGPALADLTVYIPEMEFWLGAETVRTSQLDAVIRAHTLAGARRPILTSVGIQGVLKGFIDLVFEHHGRYYVLDYKSNWLGPENEAYTPTAMRDTILAHRYDLQYVLYLFALHRLLQSRLADYDYDRDIGGAIYIFLRGTQAAGRGIFVEKPPAAMMHALDKLLGVSVCLVGD